MIKYLFLSVILLASPFRINANDLNSLKKDTRYCLDSICLFDSVDKIKNYKKGSIGEKNISALMNKWPVCDLFDQHASVHSETGREIELTLHPFAAPKGQHYRVNTVKTFVKGKFTRTQVETIFNDKKVGFFTAPEAKTRALDTAGLHWAADATIKSKSIGVYRLHLEVRYDQYGSNSGIEVRYSADGINNSDYIYGQAGCNTKTPKL